MRFARRFAWLANLVAFFLALGLAAPARADQAAALTAVQAMLESWRAVVNSHTAAGTLADSHVVPYYDAGFLLDGYGPADDAKFMANDLRGATLGPITIQGVNSYDAATGIIGLRGTFDYNGTLEPFDSRTDGFFIFRCPADANCKFYGNQHIASADFQVEIRTDRMIGYSAGPRQHVNFHVEAPAGTVTGVTVSGPGISGVLALTAGGTQIEAGEGAPGVPYSFTRNAFFGGFDPSPAFTSGMSYTFTFTKADTTTVSYTVPFLGTALSDTTNGAITLLSPTGYTLADANLGSPLTLQWTLPTAYPVQNVFLWGYVRTASGAQCQAGGGGLDLPGTATSGSITLPNTCNSETITDAGVNVTAEGANGERSMYVHGFSGSTDPLGLHAPGVVVSQVHLVWNSYPGAASYEVHRATSSAGPYTLLQTAPTAYAYDLTVSPGTQYFYFVKALNGTGSPMQQSNAINITTPSCTAGDCQAPALVTGVSASADSANQVTVSWSPGSDNVGVTRYMVWRGTQLGGSFINTNVTGTSFTDFTAQPSTVYYYSVAACDATGNCSVAGPGVQVSTPAGAPVLDTSFGLAISGPRAVREGGTANFAAFAVSSSGAYTSVTPIWSVSGPASINSSGQLFAGAVSGGQQVIVSASYFDTATSSTYTATYPVLVQEGQDAWSITGQPGQGGYVRQLFSTGTNQLAAVLYSGGVFRSFDNGATWVARMNGLGSSRVQSLRNIGSTSPLWLAALDGAGVYRSSDNMGTWSPSNTGLGCTVVRGFAVSNAVTYAAMQGCGVWRSTDQGLTWSSANAGLPNGGGGLTVYGITTTATAGELFAATSAGVYYSDDGGASWSARNSGLGGPNGPVVYNVFRNSAGTFLLAAVEGGGVFKSTDAGASWTASSSGLPALHIPAGFSTSDTSRIYVPVDGYGLYVSTDGGATWSAYGSTASAIPQARAITKIGTTYWVSTFAGVYASDDDGATWTPRNAGLGGGYTTNSATNPANPNEVFATADTVYRSTDGGLTWARANNGLRGYTYGGVVLFHPTQASTLYATTNSQGVYRSSDGGSFWAPMNFGLPDMTAQSPSLRFDATGRAYIALAGRGVYRTTGGAWSALNSGLTGEALNVNSVDVSSATLYAATNDGLYFSTNDGASWTRSGWSNANPGVPVNNVRVDSAGGAVYWSVYDTDAFGTPQPQSGLYRSNDAGATATQLLSGKRIRNFRVVREGSAVTLYAINWHFPNTTDWGVLRSSDGGATWNAVNAGTANNSLTPLANSFELYGGKLVRVATRGGGVANFASASIAAPTLAIPGWSTSQVQLSWSAVSGATGYKIYRRSPAGSGAFAPLQSVASNVTAYVDAVLAGNTSYEYYVTTLVSASESIPSNLASATTQACPGADCEAPSIPSITSITATASQVTLSWTASTDNVAVMQYNVFRAFPGSTTWTQVGSVAHPSTTFTDNTVSSGTTYVYAVQASDAAGNGSLWSWGGGQVTTQGAGPTVGLSISGPRAVREGGTAAFSAFAVGNNGVFTGVAPTWSVSGPASIDTNGQLTAGAVTGGQQAIVSASYFDAGTSTTYTASYPVLVQEGQDAWTITGQPGQGGYVRTMQYMGVANQWAAGLYGGGIFRSFDNGATWVPRMNGLGSIRVQTFRGLGSNVWLAALDGAGVYRSSDNMGSWAPANAGLGCTYARAFGVSGGVTYAGMQGCGVWRSTDQGMTWSSANGSGLPNGGSGLTVYGIYTTGTAGELWMPTSAGVFYSNDGGTTWADRSTGLTGPNGPATYALYMGATYALAIVEGGGVFKTTDGVSWAPSSAGLPALHLPGGFSTSDTSRIYVPVDGHGLYVSTNGGDSWAPYGTSATLPQARFIFKSGTRYWVGSYAGIWSSDDDGATWAARNTGLAGGYATNSIANPANASEVVATADSVYKSADGGATWTRAANGLTGNTSGGVVLYHPAQANTLYVATNSQGVYRSTDGGASWAPFNSGLPSMVAQSPNLRFDASGRAYVALEGRGIYRESGGTWSALNTGLAGNALVVYVATPASGALYAATRDGLYKSTNDGASWAKTGWSSANPGIPVNGVRVDSAGTVYWSVYATDSQNQPLAQSGLYRSGDGGASATQLLAGKRIRNFTVLGSGASATIYAANWSFPNTTDWGVLRSTDGGATWNAVNAGTSNNALSPLANSFDVSGGSLVRVSLHGGGVASFVASAPAVPAAPTGVSATPFADGSIQISWSAVSGAASYNVYMATASGVTKANFASLGGHSHTGITATTYTHPAGATAGTTYYLVVTAVNAGGESVESSQVAATIPAAADTQAPTVPANVTATAASSSQIDVSWSASTDNVGVASYRVYQNGGATPVQTTSATSYSALSLSPGTTYTYTVQACDAAGNCSAQSASASATTLTSGAVSYTPQIEQSWNLMGNALDVTLDVAAIFGNQDTPVAGVTSKVFSVWKWDAVNQQWAFYSPFLSAAQNATYAANNGFTLLGSISPGEGYWVNALEPVTLPAQSGARYTLNAFSYQALPSSWNLISVAPATPVAPYEFNVQMSATPPSPGVVPQNFFSLWQWDATQSKWWFYSPLLEANGGLATVKSYAESNGYLDFETVYPPYTSQKKRLGMGAGFWVNK